MNRPMSDPALAQRILGESPAIRELRELIVQVAPSPDTVLIQGSTGAGKELVAQALHEASGRPGELVAFNVCAVSDAMFEDALFGHVRGAFTGAASDLAGYLAQAHRGTLFLDEVGELSLANQAKLLRVLQTRSFRPLGARADRRSDFRLVAATNRDLESRVRTGDFRADLFYRLKCIVLDVPPLRERSEDILLLALHFAAAAQGRGRRVQITEEALHLLEEHDWPGNVRELEHAIRSAVARSTHGVIGRAEIMAALRPAARSDHELVEREPDAAARRRLLRILDQYDGNTALVARHLGVHRSTVYTWMESFRIPRRRGVASAIRLLLPDTDAALRADSRDPPESARIQAKTGHS
jgi:transcriptional regulator with PAS, ATPase and Fis domain